MLRNLSLKFNLLALALSHEKKTPNVQIGSSGHLKLKGVSRLSFQQPSHIASVFEVLTCRHDMDLNFSSICSSCKINSVSCTKNSGVVRIHGNFYFLFPNIYYVSLYEGITLDGSCKKFKANDKQQTG